MPAFVLAVCIEARQWPHATWQWTALALSPASILAWFLALPWIMTPDPLVWDARRQIQAQGSLGLWILVHRLQHCRVVSSQDIIAAARAEARIMDPVRLSIAREALAADFVREMDELPSTRLALARQSATDLGQNTATSSGQDTPQRRL